MSNRRVKSLDYDDDIDDYEEDDLIEEGDGITDEDQEQLQKGTLKVRAILGTDVKVTDKEIRDSLWHYFYDVEKTVNYILNQQATAQARATKQIASKKSKDVTMIPLDMRTYSRLPNPKPFTPREFFADCPWLEVPPCRLAEISIEPSYPRSGLLGGSAEGTPKKSKLAALVAAKRKENPKPALNSPSGVSSSVALLDKLNISKDVADESNKRLSEQEPSGPLRPRKYPIRRSQPETDAQPEPEPTPAAEPEPTTEEDLGPLLAAPSTFAQTLIGSSVQTQPHPAEFPSSFAPYRVPQEFSNRIKLNPFAGPSPDDVVSQAQSGSKAANKQASPTASMPKPGNKKAVEALSNGISKVNITEAPRLKSKNLNVVAEYAKAQKKNALNFVVIGHVDAGKSTLMGRLLLDLGIFDQRQHMKNTKEAEQIGKGSFALAWIMDQGSEERERGVTIDIAQNKFETEKTVFTILDAPGHRDFIPNMIAGAAQADFAVLVIDAGTGAFESGLRGQTKEHALLARSIGVTRLIIAVNKLDSQGWRKDRFDEIATQTSNFLTAAGFQSKNISFVPCSGLTGDNVTHHADTTDANWYTGPILLEALEQSDPAKRAIEGPLRLPIADIFRGGVQNPLSISGRIDSGSLQVGEQLLAVPSNETAYIRGIDVDNEPSDYAVAGQNVVIHLGEIDPAHLRAGDILCSPDMPLQSSREFSIKALLFEHITPMHLDVHRGRLHVPARVSQLTALLDKASGQVTKRKPKLLKPGEVARLRVVVEGEQGLPLEKGMRVVLRAGGETLAAGLVE